MNPSVDASAQTTQSIERPRLSFQPGFLPPLMVYLSAGLQMLTSIAETFFIKERLGFSAEYLAALGFWAALPHSCKMPVGHIVDLLWRFKHSLIYLGALCMAGSMAIMLGLLIAPQQMAQTMSIPAWFVSASLLSPIAFVLQDVVADAMTVEAVQTVDAQGRAYSAQAIKGFHTSLQLLGRMALMGGSLLVGLINVVFFAGTEDYSVAQKLRLYEIVFTSAFIIPVISVAGVWLARWLQPAGAREPSGKAVPANWLILGGSLAYTAFALVAGLSAWPGREEMVFVVSLAIVLFLMRHMMGSLQADARNSLVATAIIIFFFRLAPGEGAGVNWWRIDVLGFDASFLSRLGLLGSALTLMGVWLFRAQMMQWSLARLTVAVTLLGAVLYLPNVGMAYGFHVWSAAHTASVVDARFIALVDTAIASPLAQILFVPMLAWIANTAPENLKATYFAVMASFTNLALSGAQLLTTYLNRAFTLAREVRDPLTQAVITQANYQDLPAYLLTVLAASVAFPLAAVLFVRARGWRSA